MIEYTPVELAARELINAADSMGTRSFREAMAADTARELDGLLNGVAALAALHEIADLGSCGGRGGLSRAVDIATTAIAQIDSAECKSAAGKPDKQ